MLRKLRESRENEEGFTLIELLVVVIIIGILAAIAIPVFLNQRQSAWERSAQSDARNAAIDVETFYTTNNDYPTALVYGASTDTAAGVQVSPNVTLYYSFDATTNVYTITATHENINSGDDVVALYDSGAGGLQQNIPTTASVPESGGVTQPSE